MASAFNGTGIAFLALAWSGWTQSKRLRETREFAESTFRSRWGDERNAHQRTACGARSAEKNYRALGTPIGIRSAIANRGWVYREAGGDLCGACLTKIGAIFQKKFTAENPENSTYKVPRAAHWVHRNWAATKDGNRANSGHTKRPLTAIVRWRYRPDAAVQGVG